MASSLFARAAKLELNGDGGGVSIEELLLLLLLFLGDCGELLPLLLPAVTAIIDCC